MAAYVYVCEFFPGISRETIDRFMDGLMEELESQGIVAGGSYNRTCANVTITFPGAMGIETIVRIIMAVNDRYHCVKGWRHGPVDDE